MDDFAKLNNVNTADTGRRKQKEVGQAGVCAVRDQRCERGKEN